MNKLALHNIEKSYDANIVLKFDALTIPHGIYWLKGGNGIGKTTFFRVLTGQTPFKGQVVLDDINLRDHPTAFRSKISYAEAEPQYPSFVTGRELIRFYQEVRKSTTEQIEALAQLFDMTTYLDQKVGGYSSGMLKKLSLICAFIGEIDLYILDEPLITIDTQSAEKLYQLINQKAQAGKSFFLSSHQDIDRDKITLDGVLEIKDKQVRIC